MTDLGRLPNDDTDDRALLPRATDVLESISEAFVLLDKGWRFRYINAQAEALFERSRDELLGRCIWDAFPETVTSALYDSFLKAVEGAEPVTVSEFFPSLYRWLELRALPVEEELHVYFTDITNKKTAGKVRNQVNDILELRVKERTAQLEKLNEQLLHDALHDALTGLPNRALFMDRLEQAMKRAERSLEQTFAVLFLDFDRFKVVNDSLGHAIGDALLVAIGQGLRTCLRPADTVARLGGDEFIILLEMTSSPQEAIVVAERIQRQLAKPFVVHGHEIHVSASIGIVLVEGAQQTAQEILRDADLAMYRAKGQGKACYALFDIVMRERAVALMTMESDLRLALEREQLQVHYQPLFEIQKGSVVGFEALVRWPHPKLGFISPAEFIPLAEETGLIFKLDHWVFREACRQLRRWQEAFPQSPPLNLSVNFSSQQFVRPDLITQLRQTFQATGYDAKNLNLEITETLMMNHTARVQDNLRAIKQLGVNVHLDDFGTGYSSLGYLQRFPAHSIKIDRSFIEKIEEGREGAELVQTIITMAHNLGMQVVAEGVETATQLAKLREMRCEYAQGYYFSKPLNPAQAEHLLAGAGVAVAV